ncbi:MAG: [protein-PII] uridylyltransferase [Alphaproteobacteria bacterium]|nr:[protein-PII] uridylyltransferase [Alphaproteobacteria bacterium]
MDFTSIKKRRAIIDRKGLTLALEAVLERRLADAEDRAARLSLLKEALARGRAEVKRRFMADQDGAVAVAGLAFLVDQLVRVLYDIASRRLYPSANPTKEELLAIAAVGGYGRGELAPQSDVDLLFIHSYKLTARSEQIVENILYTLWDLGLTVGHATRSVDECIRQAKSDVTITTAMLEARFVWGERSLYDRFRRAFEKSVLSAGGAAFLEAKLRERDERHGRLGDSRYVLEPNIKDGKGGLRDLHTLYWAAKYLYRVRTLEELVERKMLTKRELARFDKAQQFLWTLRCHLHYLTGRAEERLTFDIQPELARRMGYVGRNGASGVERFMKHYFLIAKDVGDLTRIFCAGFEAQHQKIPLFSLARFASDKVVEGFPVNAGRLDRPERAWFKSNPVDMLRIFDVSHRTGLDIHPDALRSITRHLRAIDTETRDDPKANALFLGILCSNKNPETTLRRMNECGLFGRFMPDFGRVVAQMQYDMYHVYTTDEHTIRAIGILNRIEAQELTDDHPLASKIISKVLSREVLYVALLLHDIAKGRGGDHSTLGADVAREVCPKLGFNEEQTETIAWLVFYHLAMSNTAFKRDIDDPKTVADFVALVQSPERLRLLLCLTVCDIRAVGPSVWNNWKATLLRDLYYRAEALITEGLESGGREARAEVARRDLNQALAGASWPQEWVETHIGRLPDPYLLASDVGTLVKHAEMIRDAEARGQPLAIDARVLADKDVTEVTIFAQDHPGLFNRLSGALAVCGASIVDARITTLKDGMALDVFTVQDAAAGGAFKSSSKLARLSVLVEQVLSGRISPLEELDKRATQLPSRMEAFSVPPRVLIDNGASNTHTLIEVNGRDRSALVYRLTRALIGLGLQISTAKISTFGERVVDAFYVKDVFGMKVTHEAKLAEIRKTLLAVLDAANPDPPGASESDNPAVAARLAAE